MKNILLVTITMAMLLTGCSESAPKIDRRSRFQSGLDYKRVALAPQKYSIKEIDSFIESIDMYTEVMKTQYGEKFWDSEDYSNLLDAKRIFLQSYENRLAGN
ncbi:MAG: hypothetical protein ACRCXT_19780 [Paraclostridium sp.]